MTPPGMQFGLVALTLGLGSFFLHPAAEADGQTPHNRFADEPERNPAEPQQWRVIWTTDPQHTATLSWSTVADTERNRAWIWPADQPGSKRQVAAQHNGPFTLHGSEKRDLDPLYFHHVRMDGLKPGTLYAFELESDGTRSATLKFRAAPARDSTKSFSLLYGGDSRTGKDDRQRMNRFAAELTEALPETIAFVHGGDYVYNGRMFAQWSDWLTHDELRTTADGRVLPIVPTRGNHDVGYLYNEVFDTPGLLGENYYHTTLPGGANLLTLNTNISHAGDQRVWLKDQLESLRPESRWLLTQYHRPAYPAVKDPGDSKAAWVPLFEAFDVDLAFESDGHAIKRTMAIRDDKPDPTGVVYIGEGGLGVPQRTPYSDRWYLQEPGMSGRGHHLTTVTFSGDELRLVTRGFAVDGESGRMVDPDGPPIVFDEFVLRRRGAPAATGEEE